MRDNCEFDERQLWLRGNVFKHIVIIMGVLLLLDAFLKSSDIYWADEMYSNIIILIFATMVGSVEMIIQDVYLGKRNNSKIIIGLMGLSGTVGFVLTVFELISGKSKFLLNGQLTNSGSGFIIDLCILTIVITYIIKSNYNKKLEFEE
ncbi:hypothetical protein [Clostridium sp. YIM B02551]|uniref:hypothetical protein n=1 Tax=Clostridium sp. YIM B02551 TaxID=2910679 RepID=UPI001EE9F1CF|nr:hypothetical protein [Clostridium sp. YIM B02551]